MSNVERIRKQLTTMASEAFEIARKLGDDKRTLEAEQTEVKRILGGSTTEVDKAMVTAIDDAVTQVDVARTKLGEFSAVASARHV